MLQKKSSGVDPQYLDVWLPAHQGDADVVEKLVSNNATHNLLYIHIYSIFCRNDIPRS